VISPRYCRKCGTNLPPDSQFCPTCGTSQFTTGHAATNRPSQPLPAQSHMGTGRLPAGMMLHNRYRLLEKAGQGGMGAVYVAQDIQLGDRLVAVKEMSTSRLNPQELPQAVDQFKREAHLLAHLHHANLPVIHDHFNEQDRWYLVMSFIQGSTLQAYLDAAPGHKLPVNEVVRIGIELCNALDYLHNHQPQIIFRDLKPLNIMLTPQGQIYLIDFGIARHFKREQSQDTVYYYSPGYAPPEQYGQSQTGPRSDIYSLGATLHQMLTGHNPANKPFNFPSLQLLDPSIPVPLAKLITEMLDMNEQQRPPSMAAVKAELEKVRNPLPIPETQLAVEEKKPQEQPKEAKVVREEISGTLGENTDLTWKQVWINAKQVWTNSMTLLKKRLTQIILWIGFILLSAAFTAVAIIQGDSTFVLANISGIGATLVGSVLLMIRRQSTIRMIGSILLTGFSILVTLDFFYPTKYTLLVGYYYTLQNIIVIFSLFLLAIGTSLFLRKANAFMRVIFSMFLSIIGIIIFILHNHYNDYYYNDYNDYYYNDYHYYYYNLTFTSIIQIITGGLIFLLTLSILVIKITRNSLRKRG
jgi:serine/threonine protein kinase